MLIDTVNAHLLATEHRRALHAEADAFRLARLAGAGRRATREAVRRAAAAPEPPATPPPLPPVRVRENDAAQNVGAENVGADRRCPVPR